MDLSVSVLEYIDILEYALSLNMDIKYALSNAMEAGLRKKECDVVVAVRYRLREGDSPFTVGLENIGLVGTVYGV